MATYDVTVSDFLSRTLSRVPAGFDLPEPLRLLFEWVGRQGFVVTGRDGDLYGSISRDAWVGTRVELRGFTADQTASYVASWFGTTTGDPGARLWPFAQTGGEGSMAALWRDDDGRTRIVHLGSGSGSMMTCVLADNGLDFLRLLAIGYRAICWNAEFGAPPQPAGEDHEIVNAPYRDWLRRTFGEQVTIPETALEVVPEPAEMGDPGTRDPFCRWVDTVLDTE
ncbi:hypothetical protein GCM10010112_70230 [Actinoplanes lobatus]|uniref:SMI1/KNR4 family protein n=1 Tax=Actinoplanes lobatus TaxID=113568 RepID=A0ABQ4AF33_9ACTN|nr:hypothetical protein GCM10010112_70230 [Actinoplanes lobatus]GIE39607.1 hypothetical protein Alo02nite_25050 [Actinoplanes lobatus]